MFFFSLSQLTWATEQFIQAKVETSTKLSGSTSKPITEFST